MLIDENVIMDWERNEQELNECFMMYWININIGMNLY